MNRPLLARLTACLALLALPALALPPAADAQGLATARTEPLPIRVQGYG